MVSLHLAAALLAISSPGETVLLDFHSDHCPPCREMRPAVNRLAAKGYPVKPVNIDHDPDRLASQFRVNGVPTFILLVDGREVDRVVGLTSFERLQGIMDNAAVAGRNPRGQSPEAIGWNEQPLVDNPPLKDMGRWPAPDVVDPMPMAPDRRAVPPVSNSPFIQASVRLKINDGHGSSVGSGTIIDTRAGEALILTCGHVFREAGTKGEIWVELFTADGPERVRGLLVSYDDKNDVGLVSIRTRSRIAAARIAPVDTLITPGTKVVSVGCDNGDDPTERWSQVTSINKYEGTSNLQVAGQPVQGRSGGGLFTADGQVIGVCNAADPQDNEGFFAALPAIYSELDRNGLTYVYKPAQRPSRAREMAVSPPPMGKRMPPVSEGRPSAEPNRPAPNQLAPGRLSDQEQAALDELREKAKGGEIIVIVQRPDGTNEIIIIKQASAAFIGALAEQHQRQPQQTERPKALTSMELESQ